jgi:hypothetical protein
MSGPDGSMTKRDNRRNTRRAQFEMRQAERRRERERKIRRQRIQRYAIIGGSIVVFLLVGFLIIHAVIGSTGTSTAPHQGPYTTPASGDTRDGLGCLSAEGTVAHYHAYMEMFVDGQQVSIPAGIGIVGPQDGTFEPAQATNGDMICYYPLHVHGATPDIIHVESQVANRVYNLGQFFDIWGQPLSATRIWRYKADSTHPLTFELFNASGQLSRVTGDPRNIVIQAHETIVVLYNSANVHPQPFSNWGGL